MILIYNFKWVQKKGEYMLTSSREKGYTTMPFFCERFHRTWVVKATEFS